MAVNVLRQSSGSKQLATHPQLEARARVVAGHLAKTMRLEHSRLGEGITARWSSLAENVAWGDTLEDAYAALERSPDHRANMLDPRFRYMGIGVAQSVDGRVWVAQLFMSP